MTRRTWDQFHAEYMSSLRISPPYEPAGIGKPSRDPVMDEYNARMKAALAIVNDQRAPKYLKKKAAVWAELSCLTLTRQQIRTILPLLSDPREKRGRHGIGAETARRLVAVAKRAVDGEGPYTAARKVLEESGARGELRGKAGHLARLQKRHALIRGE